MMGECRRGSQIYKNLQGKKKKKNLQGRSTWVTQSVKHLTFGFGSGCDLSVVRLSPRSGSELNRESA